MTDQDATQIEVAADEAKGKSPEAWWASLRDDQPVTLTGGDLRRLVLSYPPAAVGGFSALVADIGRLRDRLRETLAVLSDDEVGALYPLTRVLHEVAYKEERERRKAAGELE
jgi:hypothetical protein